MSLPIATALRVAARLLSAVFDMPEETFTGPKKGSPPQVHARQVLIYLLNTEADFQQSDIAQALGRHHSTIGHAVEVVTAMREDDELDAALTRLGEMLRDILQAHSRLPTLVETLAA